LAEKLQDGFEQKGTEETEKQNVSATPVFSLPRLTKNNLSQI